MAKISKAKKKAAHRTGLLNRLKRRKQFNQNLKLNPTMERFRALLGL